MPTSCKHIQPLDKDAARARVECLVRELEKKPGNAFEEAKAVLKHLTLGTVPQQGYFEFTYGFGDLVVDKGIFKPPGVMGQPGFPVNVVPCANCVKFQKPFNEKFPVPLLLNLSKNLEVFQIFKDIYSKPSATGSTTGYRTVPITYRRPGEVIGLFETLRPLIRRPAFYGPFYVSAGSRNCQLVLPLDGRYSSLVRALSHAHSNIRTHNQEMDAIEYGIDTASRLEGIASDWRVVRNTVGNAEWEASLLMLPDGFLSEPPSSHSASQSGTPNLLQAFFRAGFDQLQDALSAFTPPESGDHDQDTFIFMNIETPSVRAMMNHLKSSIEGERFVHYAATTQDDNGPWPALFQKLSELNEYEVTQQRYLPVLLEPRKLDKAFHGPAIVSFVNPFIPQGLYVTHRSNNKWVPKFAARMKKQLLTGFAEIYPFEAANDKEDLAKLKKINSKCWPAFPSSALLGEQVGKLCRKTCLSQFMTVRYRRKVGVSAVAGDTTK